MQYRGERCTCALLALGAVALAALAGCGAADEPLDPADLELRDLLGVAPRVATGWDAEQRAAARAVLAAGLVERAAEPVAHGAVVRDGAAVIVALADVDGRLAERGRDALGLVHVDPAAAMAQAIDAPIAAAALLDDAVPPSATVLELDAAAWPCAHDESCDLGILAALAADAAPDAARVRVLPAMQLATIAALVPAGGDGVPTLLVNPIVTAVAEPQPPAVAAIGPGGRVPAWFAAPTRARVRVLPLTTGTWSYDPTIAACASAVQSDCTACLAGGACPTVWPSVSGRDACTMLQQQPGEDYDLVCIDLAVSLADVRACVAGRAPTCAMDADAIGDPGMLRNNSNFASDPTCKAALEACLDQLFGSSGSGDGGGCGSCDGCDCGSCDGGNDTSSCSQNNDNNGCDNGNCSNGGCGDQNGGCGGGNGGSCSVARAPSQGAGAAAGLAWALLPVPAALLARRRARRRSRAELAPTGDGDRC